MVDRGHILLVDHKNADLWLPTGGHVEPGEDPRATVVRELHEELGLTATIDEVGPPRMVTVTTTVGRTPGHTDVSLWYVVNGRRTAPLTWDEDEPRGAVVRVPGGARGAQRPTPGEIPRQAQRT